MNKSFANIMKMSLLLLFISGCNAQPAPTPKTSKSSGAAVSTGGGAKASGLVGNQPVSDNMGTVSDLSAQDAQIQAEVAKSQAAANNSKTNQQTASDLRLDQFYKCSTHLSHGFVKVVTTPGSDVSSAHLAQGLKDSLKMITDDIRGIKRGAYEAYSAVKDKNGKLFVFFESEGDRFVYFSYLRDDGGWVTAQKLAGFNGLPTASLDSKSQNIIVNVFGSDNKLYTFTQSGDSTFTQSPDSTSSTQDAFDKLQAANGATMESTANVTQNVLPTPAEAPSMMSSLLGRGIQDLMTFGAAEAVRYEYKADEVAATAVFADIGKAVCP